MAHFGRYFSSLKGADIHQPSLPASFFQNPVIMLAPMAGVTDYPFREMVRQAGGCTLTISEMIASQAMIRKIDRSLQRSCQHQEVTGVQLAGNDPEVMAEAGRMVEDQGACLIDINMGCPVKKIAINSYAGSALMKDEVLIGKIFKALVKAVSVPVTVKIRKGWDDANQNALSVARIAKEEGLAYVTLHGRTRSQLFHGKADWDFISDVQRQIDLPIVGNGDITTCEEAKTVLSGTTGIMVGRGCYGKPWFLDQIHHFLSTGEKKKDPPLTMQKTLVLQHFESMLSYYGLTQGVLMARKHLGWYSKGLPGAQDFRVHVFQQQEPQAIRQSIVDFYDRAMETLL